MREPTFARWLGTVAYHTAWDLQRATRDKLIDAKRENPATNLPHVIFGVEHPPVYTLGKSANPENLLADEAQLRRLGAQSVEIDRGGDITFHGPGQLVVYPILDLERIFTDLGLYLRMLEEAVIETIADYGIVGDRVKGRTGVWVGPDDRGPERKICAMGIHCSRWVTTHGLALNVDTDLDYFSHIVPCGIEDRGVTSMKAESRPRNETQPFTTRDVFALLIDRMSEKLGLEIRPDVTAG